MKKTIKEAVNLYKIVFENFIFSTMYLIYFLYLYGIVDGTSKLLKYSDLKNIISDDIREEKESELDEAIQISCFCTIINSIVWGITYYIILKSI